MYRKLIYALVLLTYSSGTTGTWLDDVYSFCVDGGAAHEAECAGVIVATAAGTAVAIKKLLATGCCGSYMDNIPADHLAAFEAADFLVKSIVQQSLMDITVYRIATRDGSFETLAYIDPISGLLEYHGDMPEPSDPSKQPIDPNGGGGGGSGGDDPHGGEEPNDPNEPDPDHPPFEPPRRKLLRKGMQ